MTKVPGLVGAALLFAGAALAADPGKPTPVSKAPPLTPVFSWTGWYVGGNAGYGWGSRTNPSISATDVGFARFLAAGGNVFPSLSPKGFIGGGQIGYDWQVNPSWVVGFVADFQGADISESATNSTGGANTFAESLSQRLDFLGTARGRLGWAVDNWLFYGSGGVAYGDVESTLGSRHSFLTFPTTFISSSRSETRAGWAAGGGINHALTANWIVGVDYLHYDLGHTSVTAVDGVGASVTASQNVAGDVVRGVINYKF